ncbi:conserved hypothetical protein [Xenorhabdus nematophila F1]|uniref:Uncharacterized protein n=1 Tax=Xenorhabdus nematophila (strain ATCC 19061 / DSM 3370 / CCUG 14189 / LMG 1036 / NCIMB 9965 / AN6) TaxID=406817 RepID=D3VJW8_XENNA|nr:hypothetical protein XNC1_2973 [Xenorhabdus nematophila ATCC 19061]CCW31857.1 conserved hypothetical protein [Xenorhabdus nematophila F1]CEE90382.1 hypothetical protein XNA1_1460013 [Xenorhabdus nematophila str. Anatoliense]CEF28494.1 hypothetical protein XNW1_1110012 [Xenorhabdus nematophila str. Websteri]CEK23847.1 hypothetical protein XNC2_2853 [Xenorhabdus nematophila AN6/1]
MVFLICYKRGDSIDQECESYEIHIAIMLSLYSRERVTSLSE